MDIYFEKSDGSLYNENKFKMMFKRDNLLDQIKDGRVKIEPYDEASEQKEIELANKSAQERAWRDAELVKSDLELLKAIEVDYPELAAKRQALRDYPQQAKFPNVKRP